MKIDRKAWLIILPIFYSTIILIGVVTYFAVSAAVGKTAVLTTFIVVAISAVFLIGVFFYLYNIFSQGTVWAFNVLSEAMKKLANGDYSFDLSDTDTELEQASASLRRIQETLRNLTSHLNEQINEKAGDYRKSLAMIEIQNQLLKDSRMELEKFRLAVAEAPIHIIITDADGKILYANKAAAHVTGYSIDEMIGNTPSIWGGQMPKEFYETLWKTIKSDRTYFTGEVKNRKKNGETYTAEIRIEPILNPENIPQFFVGIEEDITKRKEIDRMKTEFIALASHQLRTPLTAIRWLLEQILSDKSSLPEKTRNLLSDAYGSALRMVELVKTLLDISRLEAGKLEVRPKITDIRDFLGNVISEIKPKADAKKQTLALHIESDASALTTDPVLLTNVLMNLLTNAVKYSRPGKMISINAVRNREMIAFEVSDEGIGIPENQKRRIFERFFRADNTETVHEEGTGLGLYLVKEIVGLLGGTITFTSIEGQGTTFRVELPVTKEA